MYNNSFLVQVVGLLVIALLVAPMQGANSQNAIVKGCNRLIVNNKFSLLLDMIKIASTSLFLEFFTAAKMNKSV